MSDPPMYPWSDDIHTYVNRAAAIEWKHEEVLLEKTRFTPAHVSGCYIFWKSCRTPLDRQKWPFSYTTRALPHLSAHVNARPAPIKPRADDI